METACSDVKDNDGGKITNGKQQCLPTGIFQASTGTINVTTELTTFVLENGVPALFFPGSMALEYLPVSHLNNRFLLKTNSRWPEAPNMCRPQA